MRQLTVINEKLREAVDGCKDRTIERYPDLEITNIDKFMGDLVESTQTLVDDVDMVKIIGWFAEVKEDGLNPKLEELAGIHEDHNIRWSPEIGSEEETKLTSLPPPPSRTQEPAGTEDSAEGGPQQREAP